MNRYAVVIGACRGSALLISRLEEDWEEGSRDRQADVDLKARKHQEEKHG